MICGVGLDLVREDRIKRLWRRYGERFLRRVFSEEEITYALARKQPERSLAAAFAVKEAFGKALGTGVMGFGLREVSLRRDPFSGKPEVYLSGRAKILFQERAERILVSVTHEAGLAIAIVILERGN